MAGFQYLTHWTTFNPSSGGTAFNGPADVAFLQSNGNMLIVDSNAGVCPVGDCSTVGAAPPTQGEVVIQQTDGTYVGLVTPNNNSGPTRTAVDPNSGDVYIGTYYESKVRRYTEAGGTLTLANTWTECTANGGNGPYTWGKTFGLAVTSGGEIYVSDYDNLRIIKMNTAGQCTAAAITGYGAGSTTFQNLTGLAVDSSDNLWVADYGKKVLVKYNSAGVWQQTITGYTNCGTTTAFASQADIDIDKTNNDMYVTELSGANAGVIKLDASGNFLSKMHKYNNDTLTISTTFGGGLSGSTWYQADYSRGIAKFTTPTRKVSVTASANGTVSATGGIIAGATNGNTCVDQFIDNTTVVLTAVPASGGYVVTWGGDGASCTGNTCTLSNITADKTVTADFSVPNTAPVATVNAITGTATVGQTLTGNYSYGDADSDAEDTSGNGSGYQWKRGATDVASSASNIGGASGATGGANAATKPAYTPIATDREQYLFYCVTPKASAGVTDGAEACSAGLQVSNDALTLTVTTNADPGATGGCVSNPATDCSLRDAIATASATVVDTINFNLSAGLKTITLGSPLAIGKSLTIDGTGQKITVSGNGAVRVFAVASGAATLKSLTVTGGSAADGGGLSNTGGAVTVRNGAFTGNTATSTGGAIHNASGDLTVINSTFAGNAAATGGASLSVAGGAVTVINSSFAGTAAGGEIARTGGTVTPTNTLIDNATLTCTGTITDGGHNLDRGTGCGFGVASNSQSSVNPLLGALGDHGGDTQTLPLLPGSPAIDAGDATVCADAATVNSLDQRGIARPAACDIGAFESRGFTLAKTGGDNRSATVSTAFTDPLAVSVTATGAGEPADGGQVTFTAPVSGASAALAGSPATIAGGSASVNATANATAGGYQVAASAAGATAVNFSLTNNSLPSPVDGACGSANGQTFTSAPTGNLCGVGTASTVTSTVSDFTWTCAGSNGGTDAGCSATRAYTATTTGITGHGPDPALTGQAVTVTYAVAPATGPGVPTGPVTIDADTGETCTAPVAAGACDLTFATAGKKTLTATYPGDTTFAGSTSAPQTQRVDLIAQGTVPGGGGTITVRGAVSDGTAVPFTDARFLAAQGDPASPPDLPPGVRFPHGLFAFTVANLPTTGTPAGVTFTLTYPDPLPAGTRYWKYGPTTAQPAPHWYVLPAIVAGNRITFTVTDGGPGDSDLSVNGAITDPGGPDAGGAVADIPTLGEWALLLLGLALAGLAWRERWRRAGP